MEEKPIMPLGRPLRRYGNGRRVFYGGLWSLYTLICAVGTVSWLSQGLFSAALLGIVLACLMGWYAYRIWTWRARRLWLLIFF